METEVKTQSIGVGEFICDTAAEQSVEADFTIPDYLPEIFKIVKAISEPVIVQRIAVGARVTVEGYVKLTVLYSPGENGGLCSVVQKLPFSKQADMKMAAADSCIVFCDAEISYINCRAVGSRRIDARGAVNLYIKVVSSEESAVVSGTDRAGMHCRFADINYVSLEAQNEKQFTINESLAVDSGTDGEITVLRCEAEASSVTTELKAGRLSVNGAVTVTLAVDASEDSELKVRRFVYNLPFSRLVELDAYSEDSVAAAAVNVLSCAAEPGSDGVVDVSVTCEAEAYGTRPDTVSLVSDVFSTACELETDSDTVQFIGALTPVNEQLSLTVTAIKPEEGRLVDFFMHGAHASLARDEEGQVSIICKAALCCVLCRQSGELTAFDVPVETKVASDSLAFSGVPVAMLRPVFDSVECRDSSEGIVLRASGCVNGISADLVKTPAVKAVTFVPDGTKRRDNTAMSVYFADPGESVWSIAKLFNTSPSAVYLTNGLSEDDGFTARTMLVIPIVS